MKKSRFWWSISVFEVWAHRRHIRYELRSAGRTLERRAGLVCSSNLRREAITRILLKNVYNSFMHFLLLNICTMRDKQIRKSMSIKSSTACTVYWIIPVRVFCWKCLYRSQCSIWNVYCYPLLFWQLSQSKWYAFFNIKSSLQNRSIEHLRTCVFHPPCVFEVVQDTEDNVLKNKHFKITAHWKIPWKQSFRCCANPPKEGTLLLKRCLCSI